MDRRGREEREEVVAGTVYYHQSPPPPDLSPYVFCIWELCATRPRGTPAPRERAFPDGCEELIFHLGDPFHGVERDGTLKEQRPSLLAGVTTRPVEFHPSARAHVIGVRFRPAGARLLSREPRDRWLDRTIALEELGEVELGRVASARNAEDARAAIYSSLRSRAAETLPSSLGPAVEALARGASVDDVARTLGWSARRLQRRFRDEVGIGPKRLARTFRFQRLVRVLSGPAASRPTLTSVAHRFGFSEHAHVTREFRELAGMSPSQFLEGENALARAFAEDPE